MNYIVFDLEWNQSPDGKKSSNCDIPFEIIQIGAVRMDDNFQIQDEFCGYIKPVVYTSFHKKVDEIIGITMEELNEKGDYFPVVADDFLRWCGSDVIFCTWGGTDLTELQRNLAYYDIDYKFAKPLLYYDVQKLFSINYSDGKSRVTLQKAIEELKIEQKDDYHMAVNDARYTAKILEKLDIKTVGKFYSVDTYRIPSSRKEEIHLNFGNYEKYISRGFSTRENASESRDVRTYQCFECGKPMKKLIKWFSTNSKTYYGLFECEEHGYVKGRYRIKSTDSDKYYAVRILKFTNEEGAGKIKERKLSEQEARRARRKAH